MLSATPQLQLETLVILDARGRIVSTREPFPSPSPSFLLIRGAAGLAWAVRAGVAEELGDLVRQEAASAGWEQPPLHAQRYLALLPGRVHWGPAFQFPEATDAPPGVVKVHEEARLEKHFSGWIEGEIAAGAAPMMGVFADGEPVSVCFCARRSVVAAEAGLETAADFRGRGHGPRVTAAWAAAVRASGRTPLYSTDWDNAASLAVVRTLGLRMYATDWSLTE